ncbi:hypothetical protein VNO77_19350 [Canavalia gladiata]|uniref:Uncharacterized protein n=1 Tax=Canavalia gladiata TaxID=3824 RepID=A0AAN9QIE8_CANGL
MIALENTIVRRPDLVVYQAIAFFDKIGVQPLLYWSLMLISGEVIPSSMKTMRIAPYEITCPSQCLQERVSSMVHEHCAFIINDIPLCLVCCQASGGVLKGSESESEKYSLAGHVHIGVNLQAKRSKQDQKKETPTQCGNKIMDTLGSSPSLRMRSSYAGKPPKPSPNRLSRLSHSQVPLKPPSHRASSIHSQALKPLPISSSRLSRLSHPQALLKPPAKPLKPIQFP